MVIQEVLITNLSFLCIMWIMSLKHVLGKSHHHILNSSWLFADLEKTSVMVVFASFQALKQQQQQQLQKRRPECKCDELGDIWLFTCLFLPKKMWYHGYCHVSMHAKTALILGVAIQNYDLDLQDDLSQSQIFKKDKYLNCLHCSDLLFMQRINLPG